MTKTGMHLTITVAHTVNFHPIHNGVFQINIFKGGLPASHVPVIGISSTVSPRFKNGQSLGLEDGFDVHFPLFHDFLVFLAPTCVELKWLVKNRFWTDVPCCGGQNGAWTSINDWAGPGLLWKHLWYPCPCTFSCNLWSVGSPNKMGKMWCSRFRAIRSPLYRRSLTLLP